MEVQGDSFPDTTIQHASELWFIPEIERRRSAGSLPEGFTLWAAQVVMDIDTPGPLVRLNEEIRGVFEAEAPRKIDAGEIVRLGDLGDIKAMDLTADDPNAGHLTVLLHNQPDERSTFCRDKFRGNTAWAPPDPQERKGRFHPGIPYGVLDVDHGGKSFPQGVTGAGGGATSGAGGQLEGLPLGGSVGERNQAASPP